MFPSKRIFWIAQVLALAIVVAALFVFPGAQWWSTALAFCGAWGLVALAYRLLPCNNAGGWWTLLIVTTLTAVGTIINIWGWTTAVGRTTADPLFTNWDMLRYWEEAQWWNGSGQEVVYAQTGYGGIIWMLWCLTGGVSVVPIMVLNTLVSVLSIIVAAKVSVVALDQFTPWTRAKVHTWAMAIISLTAYYSVNGTVLLKESWIFLGMAMAVWAFLALRQGENKRLPLWGIVGAVAILSVVRPGWILVLVLGAVCMIPWGVFKKLLPVLLALVVVAVAFDLTVREKSWFYVMANPFIHNETAFAFNTLGREKYEQFLITLGYFSEPIFYRMLFLPLTLGVQYLSPFPYNFSYVADMAVTMPLMKLSYMWYLTGGVVIFYLFRAVRQGPKTVNRLLLWAILVYVGLAFFTGGTQARYTVPLLCLVIPAALYVLSHRRYYTALRRWAIAYVALVAVALAAAYHIQHSNILM